MPPPGEKERRWTLQQIAADTGVYPVEAYEFVREGLGYTVEKIHGPADDSHKSRHVSGQQLCEGLRDYAHGQWGMLARTVLWRWNITETIDFGQIVFSLVKRRVMATSRDDNIEDFRNVYDFRTAFESQYRIVGNV